MQLICIKMDIKVIMMPHCYEYILKSLSLICVQSIEHWPSDHKVLGLIPGTTNSTYEYWELIGVVLSTGS